VTDSTDEKRTSILARLRLAVLGDYEILGETEGSETGVVYLAHDLALNRQVVIKLVSFSPVVDPIIRSRALDIASLGHQNIASLYAFRVSDGITWIVRQFIEGSSLEHVLRTAGTLPVPIVRGVLNMIGRALNYAHGRGVFHGDVRPSNILLGVTGDATLTDFFISRLTGLEAATDSRRVLGSRMYMSPEQLDGGAATAASDQYALGVVAYEMLTGLSPFSGSPIAPIEAHQNLRRFPLRISRPDCPPELEFGVLRMLANEPTDRWPSLAHALEELGPASPFAADQLRAAIAELVRKPETDGDSVVREGGAVLFLDETASAVLDDKTLDVHAHGDHFHFSIDEQEGG